MHPRKLKPGNGQLSIFNGQWSMILAEGLGAYEFQIAIKMILTGHLNKDLRVTIFRQYVATSKNPTRATA